MPIDDLTPDVPDAALLSNRVSLLAQFLCVSPSPTLEVTLLDGRTVITGPIVALARGPGGPLVSLDDGGKRHDIGVRDILEVRVVHAHHG